MAIDVVSYLLQKPSSRRAGDGRFRRGRSATGCSKRNLLGGCAKESLRMSVAESAC